MLLKYMQNVHIPNPFLERQASRGTMELGILCFWTFMTAVTCH